VPTELHEETVGGEVADEEAMRLLRRDAAA
jgi:hypothetical protein